MCIGAGRGRLERNNLWPLLEGALEFEDDPNDDDGNGLLLLLLEPVLLCDEFVVVDEELLDEIPIPD